MPRTLATLIVNPPGNSAPGNAQGTFTLSMNCVPGCTPVENDNCTTATPLTLQPLGGCESSTGTTQCAYAPTTPNPPCDPYAPINDVWYSFNTGWATDVEILLELVDATAVNAARVVSSYR